MDLKISPFVCCQIIRKKLDSDNFTLSNFKVKSLQNIRGYLGDYFSLVITIKRDENNETHTFFVKSLPKIPSQRSLALEMNAFFKEGRFYTNFSTKLGDVLQETVPACFFTSDEMLIFEDLTLRGFKTLPPRSSLDISCAKSGLATLAKLHASGLIYEEMNSSSLIQDFEEELGKTFFSDKDSVKKAIKSTKRGIEAVIDLTHGEEMNISKDFFKEKVFEGCDLRNEFTKPSTKFRNTILHGDPWNNNFMFKIEDGRVSSIIFDFQSYRYGPPAQDVMTFLHFTTERTLRNTHLDELLKYYYEELDQNLRNFGFKSLVSRSEFFESCKYFIRFALTQRVTRFQIIGMPEKISSELLSNPEMSKSVMFDNKYDFIVKLCRQDQTFRNMNYKAIEELRDFYLSCK